MGERFPYKQTLALRLCDVANLERLMAALDARGEPCDPLHANGLALAIAARIVAAGEDGPWRGSARVPVDPEVGLPPDPKAVSAFLARFSDKVAKSSRKRQHPTMRPRPVAGS